MDIALISAISLAVGGLLTAGSAAVVKVIRARGVDRKVELARDDARVRDCEKRFDKLSEEIKEVRNGFEKILLGQVVESARAMFLAAEAQKEGNQLQREQTRVLERVCHHLEISADRTPPNGTKA
jgi:hypothetical protein